MNNPTETEDTYKPHRAGLHSDDKPYPSEPLCYCDRPTTPTTPDNNDTRELEQPTVRDWLTLLQTNHDKSIEDQVKNIDAAYAAIEAHYSRQQKAAVEAAEVNSLLHFRELYDRYEEKQRKDFEGNPIATWSGYKWFRNPLSDRIEEITGHRDTKSVKEWLLRAGLTKEE